MRGKIFIELIYDKRNVAEFPNGRELILSELEKRVHRVFPDAGVKVKPMVTNTINTDASKGDKAKLAAIIEGMFEKPDRWLVNNM